MTHAVKDSKAKILDAFGQILAERQKIKSKVATKEEEAEKVENQRVLEAASQYTVDGIVRGLADLQLEFGGIISGLSTKLTSENSKLDQLKQALSVETEHLKEQRQIRIVADALHILSQEHQEKLQEIEYRQQSDRTSLEKDITDTRKSWQQEQEEYEALLLLSSDRTLQERTRQEADYEYDAERTRTIAADDYETIRRNLERELQEIGQAKEKQWAERERTLAANQSLLQDYQRKVEAFGTELDEAVKKSREEGIREVNQEAKVKADLQEKEWESTKQGYELQIQSLEAKIQKHTEQITEISTQLQAAMRQAQELAMRAFESSSNRFALRQE